MGRLKCHLFPPDFDNIQGLSARVAHSSVLGSRVQVRHGHNSVSSLSAVCVLEQVLNHSILYRWLDNRKPLKGFSDSFATMK